MPERFQGCSSGALLRVGYGWNEATCQACAIGEAIEATGVPVFLSSIIGRDTGVHERWDDRIASAGGSINVVSRAIAGGNVSDIIWFEVRREEARIAQRAGLRTTLVLTHPALIKGLLSSVHLYDDIVVLSQSDREKLKRYVGTSYMPTTCVQPEPLTDPRQPELRRKSLWLLDGYTARRHGPRLIVTLDVTLRRFPDLAITFLCHGSWTSSLARQLAALRRCHGERFSYDKRVSYATRHNYYQQHGSVALLSCCDATGMRVIEALCSNRPIAAFKYGIPGEILTDSGSKSWVLPATVTDPGTLASPEADIQYELLGESLGDFYSRLSAGRISEYDADVTLYLLNRRRLFETAWRRLLKLN